MVRIKINEVYCFVDLDNKQIYSAKYKKLTPYKDPRSKSVYYYLHYKKKRVNRTLNELLRSAYEELQRENR